ncbi:caspase family protein [Moorena producens]|uniref:nSTAND1 domain-containing NTPase n=1 Tax=Moorena producens TaxID=1155739 RepID=UPI003C717E9E
MFSRNLALIIGINNYTNGISPLNTAVNDAKQLAEILRTKHDYEVWVCLDEVATLSNFHKFLFHSLPEQVTENDRLFFYFAGHGVALNGDDGPAGYLIPQDALLGDTNSYLPMTKLHDALSQLPCRHFLGILDCCFAGAFRWSNTRDLLTSPEVIHQERYDRFITDPAWQIITSSASDQKALDNFYLDSVRGQVGNHSPFASALLEALEGAADIYPPAKNGKPAGDGVITATELYLYLRDRVEIPTEKYRQRQTPGIWCLNKHDKGEYIFLSPGHQLNLPPAPPLDESQNPYRGLKSFDEKHSSLFFGRTLLVEKLDYFVKANPLTVVLGASGSGKSSLVKAGLIPKLRQDNTEKWCILPPIRPGETPLPALNNVLCNAKLPNVEPQNPEHNLARTIDVWAKDNPNSKLLLFIDQSEEIITLCQNLDERKEFFQQILTAINGHRDKLRVVLTLRSDFEAQARDAGLTFVPTDYNVGNTVLKNGWHSRRFIVPAMTRAELREAIEKPAEARVMYFQPHELAEQLIDEVVDMPGALPLLSFALSELYLKYLRRQRQAKYRGITIDRALTQADYSELGGVMRSLTQRADLEYEALVNENPAYDQVIRHVMLRMVALTGGELARRRVPLSELEYPPAKNGLVKEVIERFTNARLLVIGEDADGNPYVEPAHDALVRGWQRLLEWKQNQEESLLLQRRLTTAAVEWKSQQQAKFLWHGNPRLDLLKKVLNSDNNWLNQVEAEFVRRSIGRKSFNTRRNWGVAIAVMLGLSGLTITSLIGERKSQIEQIRASREASQAKLLSNQELDALVSSLQAATTLKHSSLLRLFKPEMKLQNQVRLTLQKAFYQVKERNRITIPNDGDQVVFSPNGQLLATIKFDGNVSLWHQSGKPLTGFKPFNVGGKVRRISFSSDSQQLITVSTDEVLKYWNFNGQQVGKDLKQPGMLNELIIDSSGNPLLFSDDEGFLRLSNIKKGNPRAKFTRKYNIGADTFSPERQLISTIYPGTKITNFNVLTNPKISQLTSSYLKRNIPRSISFSPDRKLIATGGFQDDTIFLWDVNGNQLSKLKANQGGIKDISFSPDGKQLATLGRDKTLRIWQDLEGKQLTKFSIDQDFMKISVSSDSQLIAASDSQGIVNLWNLEKRQSLEFVREKFTSISELKFSPDGNLLAISETDGAIHLLDVRNNHQLTSFTVEEANLDQFGNFLARFYGFLSQGISFSEDGKWLAIGGDNNIIVRSIDGQKQAKFIEDTSRGDGIGRFWVQATAFNPSGDLLATGGIGGRVRLWNWKEQKRKQISPKLSINANTTQTISIVFNPQGNLIATAGLDGETNGVRLWNLSGDKLAEFKGHIGTVSEVIFSPDGNLLATTGSDGTVRIWDLSGQQLAQFEAGEEQEVVSVKSITFSRDSKQLVFAYQNIDNSNNYPLFWQVKSWQMEDLDELLVRGCDWVHDYLKNNPNVEESDRHLCDNVNK